MQVKKQNPEIARHSEASSVSMKITTLFLAMTAWALTMNAAEPLRRSIWGDEAPLGDGKFEKVEVPITVHLPEPSKATGIAVVICPGGGYGGKVLDGEGHGIARWLNKNGIAGM